MFWGYYWINAHIGCKIYLIDKRVYFDTILSQNTNIIISVTANDHPA